MCFTNDYDWYAMVSEQTDGAAEKPTRCDECYRTIQPGEFVHHIWQQQHEECQLCDSGECDCIKENGDSSDCCACETPEYGETFDYDRCEGCHKFLEAIKLAELDEGCAESDALPSMPMHDDLQGMGRDECKRYWIRAVREFPAFRGHFAKLWRMMFG